MELDGRNLKKLSDYTLSSLAADGDWQFPRGGERFFKIRTDGTEEAKVDLNVPLFAMIPYKG